MMSLNSCSAIAAVKLASGKKPYHNVFFRNFKQQTGQSVVARNKRSLALSYSSGVMSGLALAYCYQKLFHKDQNNSHEPSFTLKDFHAIDQSNNSEYLIKSMEAHYSVDSMLRIKKRSIEDMQLKSGDNILEVGCGLGFDAEMMAEQVSPSGSIVAIDISQKMLKEAQKRSTHDNVTYKQYDVENLPFDDDTFDGCRADRVLVSQKNISKAIDEMIRVTKSDGILTITALEFGTIVIYPYHKNTGHKLVDYWQTLVKNPWIGRKLPGLFDQKGLKNIKVTPEVFHIDNYQTLKKIVPVETMLKDMVSKGKITSKECHAMISQLKQTQNKKNSFFWSINLITVTGKK